MKKFIFALFCITVSCPTYANVIKLTPEELKSSVPFTKDVVISGHKFKAYLGVDKEALKENENAKAFSRYVMYSGYLCLNCFSYSKQYSYDEINRAELVSSDPKVLTFVQNDKYDGSILWVMYIAKFGTCLNKRSSYNGVCIQAERYAYQIDCKSRKMRTVQYSDSTDYFFKNQFNSDNTPTSWERAAPNTFGSYFIEHRCRKP